MRHILREIPRVPKAGELNSKSNHFLSWSGLLIYWPRLGIENGITKIDYHLYPVRATFSFLFLFVSFDIVHCYMSFFLFGIRCSTCSQGVPREFPAKVAVEPELIVHLSAMFIFILVFVRVSSEIWDGTGAWQRGRLFRL